MGSDFPLSFWLAFLQPLGILSILSCSEGLILFCFLFCFFSLKGVRTFYLWQLASWQLAGLGQPIPAPWHFLRAAIINRTTTLVNWGACVCPWSSCTYRKCPQVSSTFACPTGTWGNQSLRASWLPGLWNRGECDWASRKGLETHYFFPLKPHTSILSRLMPSRSRAYCWGRLGA